MLFSVEYIIPPLITNRVFNLIFPVLLVIAAYYCIGDPLLNIYPNRTLRCVYFASFPPFWGGDFMNTVTLTNIDRNYLFSATTDLGLIALTPFGG